MARKPKPPQIFSDYYAASTFVTLPVTLSTNPTTHGDVDYYGPDDMGSPDGTWTVESTLLVGISTQVERITLSKPLYWNKLPAKGPAPYHTSRPASFTNVFVPVGIYQRRWTHLAVNPVSSGRNGWDVSHRPADLTPKQGAHDVRFRFSYIDPQTHSTTTVYWHGSEAAADIHGNIIGDIGIDCLGEDVSFDARVFLLRAFIADGFPQTKVW